MMLRRGRTRMLLEAGTVVAVLLTGAWLLFRGTLYRPAPAGPAAHAAQGTKVDETIVVAGGGGVVRLSPHGGTPPPGARRRCRAGGSGRPRPRAPTDPRPRARRPTPLARGS